MRYKHIKRYVAIKRYGAWNWEAIDEAIIDNFINGHDRYLCPKCGLKFDYIEEWIDCKDAHRTDQTNTSTEDSNRADQLNTIISEKCLRCRNTIKYVMTDDGLACPECGWTKSAAENYAKENNRFWKKHAIGLRFKSTGLFLFAIFVLMLFGGIILYETVPPIRLYFNGKQAIATVKEYHYEARVRRRSISKYHYHTLHYENYTNRVDLGREYPLETQFFVLYLPTSPSVMMLGDRNISFYNLLTQRVSVFGLVLMALVFAFFLYFAYLQAKILYNGIDKD